MIVKFDKYLYSEAAVKKAIQDYMVIARIEEEDLPDYHICTIVSSEYSMERTVLEFSNYVLQLSVMGVKDTI